MGETDPVSRLKGIGPKASEALGQLGIETVGDLLRHYPVRYDSYAPPVPIAQAEEGKLAVVRGALLTTPQLHGFGRQAAVSVTLGDGSGRVGAVWFHQPYLKNTLRRGDTWDLSDGYPVPLSAFFPRRSGWRRRLMEAAEAEVRRREAAGVSRYHEGVRRKLRRYFNPHNFYLTAEGLVFFYPMYAIAPAAEGVPAFLVPWEEVRNGG